MIYAAFTFYLLLILFMGVGIYKLWTKLTRPGWVNWALLPGTVVSEMAYIFGCLITGGEIRRARLIPGKQAGAGGKAGGKDSEPTTEAAPRVKYVGPIVAALASIVACGTAIVAVRGLLGGQVINEFATGGGLLSAAALPRELPTGWEAIWHHISRQVALLRRMCETWGNVNWLDWSVPVFVYLSLCLSIRLAPVRQAIRASLAAAVAISVAAAATGFVWRRFADVLSDIWPLLTYVWASLLLMLVLTLLLLGIVALVRILTQADKTAD